MNKNILAKSQSSVHCSQNLAREVCTKVRFKRLDLRFLEIQDLS